VSTTYEYNYLRTEDKFFGALATTHKISTEPVSWLVLIIPSGDHWFRYWTYWW
jgi:hypothetical protein